MPAVTYVTSDGTTTTVEVVAATTVKDGALQNGVDGIIGECGGNAMCATCHVYIDEAWATRLPAMDAVEDALLEDTASQRTSQSRLGCQLKVSDDLDGLVVHLPAAQI